MKRCFVILCLAISGSASAATPEQIEFFEKRIRPVLAQECYECHGVATKKKGGLLLDSRDGWMKGGKSGDAIIPGKPKDSLLIQSIRHEADETKMPKNGAKLDARVIRDFEEWVNMGAPDPRDRPPTAEEIAKDTEWAAVLARRKNWWCFQPVQNPAVPAVKNSSWSENPVDRFLLAKMESENLAPAKDADARVLIRRLSFVLTGLPPTPEEADAFVTTAQKDSQAAIEAAADKMLSSPRFGERWARHWMDWMRYAETHGSEGDPQIPFAWRYRDYLIRSLNSDIPYPQLVREHIAGDLIEAPRINKEMGISESALGIAHYRMVLHGFTPTDAHDEECTFTDNQIDTISKAFLGVTVSCARCHNHKFDAISQADFYALFGIMASCRPATMDVNLPEKKNTNVRELSDLKPKIRATLADAWLKNLDLAVSKLKTYQPADKKQPLPGAFAAWTRLSTLPADKWDGEWKKLQSEWHNYAKQLEAFRGQETLQRWDLRGEDSKKWASDGAGVSQGAASAGDFHINHEGERIVTGIYPAGVFSHLVSDKHRGLLGSPTFTSEGGKLWVRARGVKAHSRYVVRNYPRSGLIFPKTDLNNENDQWLSWDMNYWKGDTLHFEISTDGDQPVEIGNSERSWFGIAEILYAKKADGPPPPAPTVSLLAFCGEQGAPKTSDELAAIYISALKRCVENFRAGKMSDDEAEFLSAFAQKDLLPNALKDLPEVAPIVADYRKLEAAVPLPTRAPGLMEGFAFDQPLMTRGNHKQLAAPVERRFLDAIDNKPYNAGSSRSGRLQLAESIVAPGNPLTSRVISNRLWQYVFGQGLVVTPDNFGRLGEAPTHPELLDYLATRFQSDGGSLKKMIRLLVTSRAFRLDHAASKDAGTRDPGNKWLTHYSSQRLDAEAIRDGMIFLAGKMDASVGGTPVGGDSNRRSVYVRVVRNDLDPLLNVFDFPVPSGPRGRRDSTNVPAQALTLLNSPLVNRWATEFSKRAVPDPKAANAEASVRRMFNEALCREPSEAELKQSLDYIQSTAGAAETVRAALAEAEAAKREPQIKELRDQLNAVSSPEYPWRCLAQALFNAKEFIYVH